MDEIVNEVKESEEWEDMEMDILDYGLELGLLEGIEKGRELGMEQGIAQGIEQGEIRTLVNLVIKKLQKGFSVSDIADIVEESESKIQQIADFIEYGLSFDEICQKYINEKRG